MRSPRELLRQRGLRPKKSWGQNFLEDVDMVHRIAQATEAGPGDVVVELGAGLGHLTTALLELGPTVVAVERDRDLVAVLAEAFVDEPRLRVLAANAATLDLGSLAAAGPVIVAGNLPYQLSTSIVFSVIEQRAHVRRAVFLLQAEFVTRLAAQPGGRDYGVLSIQAQAVADVEELFRVPKEAFHPSPSVDSAVVALTPLAKPRVAAGPFFTRVVRGAFQQRRKTLANALGNAGFAHARAGLAAAGIDATRRAETLSLDDFGRLSAALEALELP